MAGNPLGSQVDANSRLAHYGVFLVSIGGFYILSRSQAPLPLVAVLVVTLGVPLLISSARVGADFIELLSHGASHRLIFAEIRHNDWTAARKTVGTLWAYYFIAGTIFSGLVASTFTVFTHLRAIGPVELALLSALFGLIPRVAQFARGYEDARRTFIAVLTPLMSIGLPGFLLHPPSSLPTIGDLATLLAVLFPSSLFAAWLGDAGIWIAIQNGLLPKRSDLQVASMKAIEREISVRGLDYDLDKVFSEYVLADQEGDSSYKAKLKKAMYAYGRLGTAAAHHRLLSHGRLGREIVLRIASEGPVQERQAAIQSVGMTAQNVTRQEAEEILAALDGLLRDPIPEIRTEALAAMSFTASHVQSEERAISAAIQMLEDENHAVVERALQLLSTVHSASPPSEQLLRKLVKLIGVNDALGWTAINLFETVCDGQYHLLKQCESDLLWHMQTNDTNAKERILFVLGRFYGPIPAPSSGVISEIVSSFADADGRVRSQAVYAIEYHLSHLSREQAHTVAEGLLALLSDPLGPVKWRAIYALELMREKDFGMWMEPICLRLLSLLEDEGPDIPFRALHALLALLPRFPPALVEKVIRRIVILDTSRRNERKAVYQLIGKARHITQWTPSRSTIQYLMDVEKNGSGTTTEVAIWMLRILNSKIQPQDVDVIVDRLLMRIRDADPRIRGEAIDAMRSFRPRTSERKKTAMVIALLAATRDPIPGVCRRAVHALRVFRSDIQVKQRNEVASRLAELTGHPNGEVRGQARTAIRVLSREWSLVSP